MRPDEQGLLHSRGSAGEAHLPRRRSVLQHGGRQELRLRAWADAAAAPGEALGDLPAQHLPSVRAGRGRVLHRRADMPFGPSVLRELRILRGLHCHHLRASSYASSRPPRGADAGPARRLLRLLAGLALVWLQPAEQQLFAAHPGRHHEPRGVAVLGHRRRVRGRRRQRQRAARQGAGVRYLCPRAQTVASAWMVPRSEHLCGQVVSGLLRCGPPRPLQGALPWWRLRPRRLAAAVVSRRHVRPRPGPRTV
mmetsp:Transcript_86403/g.268440  ORF Transcript_86403/g.268440 Transcript_86403/m.268440 type:complete len:251 (+) Transcript_86403:302-1054(+)